jgi:pilus assembly protein FimV
MSMHTNNPGAAPPRIAGLIFILVLATFFSGPVFALGLGDITVHSHLKQRLDAVIELVVGANEDVADLKVFLGARRPGSDQDLAPPLLLRQLTFEVQREGPGAPRILVGSKEPISEPAFSFPIEVLSRKSRVTRIYSVLLNPAGYVARPQRREPAETTAVRRVPALRPPAPDAAPGDTYLVQPGDTLSAIGFRVRPDKSISGWQMALALFEANPDAFINNDVNKLKAGATLVIPSMAQVRRKTAQEARAEIIGVRPTQVAAAPAAAEAAPEPAAPDQAAQPDQPDYLFKILSPEEEQSLKLKEAEAAAPAGMSGETEAAAAGETAPEVTAGMEPEPAPAETMAQAAEQEAPTAATGAAGDTGRQAMNEEMQEITRESEQLRGEVESLRARLQETNRQLLELAEIMKRQQETSLFRFTGDRTTLSAVAGLLVVLIGLLLLLLLRQSTIYMAARSQR